MSDNCVLCLSLRGVQPRIFVDPLRVVLRSADASPGLVARFGIVSMEIEPDSRPEHWRKSRHQIRVRTADGQIAVWRHKDGWRPA